jgi:hypothetical protein
MRALQTMRFICARDVVGTHAVDPAGVADRCGRPARTNRHTE